MTHKLAFQLTNADTPNQYLIRLTDARQIAALVLDAGLRKGADIDPIAVVFDEGNGEIVPVDGYEQMSARGRIVMKVLADVYGDALAQIAARTQSCGQPTGGNARAGVVFVLQ